MRIERWIILILGIALLRAWWKPYRRRIRRWWQRAKDQMPRQLHPKSPEECPLCQVEVAGITEPISDIQAVESYRESKSRRGRKKTIQTEGYACPYPDCQYFGVTEAQRHALVGFGKLGENKDIQRLRCQACGRTFSSRKGTPLYYIKSEAKEVEEVLWWLAEGVDLSVLLRGTGNYQHFPTRGPFVAQRAAELPPVYSYNRSLSRQPFTHRKRRIRELHSPVVDI